MADDLWLASTMAAGLSPGGIAHLHPGLIRSALAEVLALRAAGDLSGPAPKVVPLATAALVHQALETRTAPGKVVLEV
jgi:NADPH:quinone reductase